MIIEKKTTLRPILESSKGIHLTAYLVNRNNLLDLKNQVSDVIHQAHEWLNPALTDEERKKFLEPVQSLLNDVKILKNIKGNIGIFRNENSFRILNIPIEVEFSCQVATSFHVKPLIRWIQGDEDFLLLGLEKNTVYLYHGSQHLFKLVDVKQFITTNIFSKTAVGASAAPEFLKNQNTDDNSFFTKVRDWIIELTKNSKTKLFFAGEPDRINILQRTIKYRNSVKSLAATSFSKAQSHEIYKNIRKVLKEKSHKNFEKELMEFRFAEEDKRVQRNIFQISKAVVQGRVRKLLVADDLSIFGKIDQNSGGVAIHPMDLDHEDDCILDDLAQMVLNQGGEVVIAKRDEIPKGRPILAILDDEGESLTKFESLQHQMTKESLP